MKDRSPTHFSTTSGKADTAENYAVVTWELDAKDDTTAVTVSQDGIATEKGIERGKANWASVLITHQHSSVPSEMTIGKGVPSLREGL